MAAVLARNSSGKIMGFLFELSWARWQRAPTWPTIRDGRAHPAVAARRQTRVSDGRLRRGWA